MVALRRTDPPINRRKAQGFTLLELCIVIILMAIMTTFTAPRLFMITEINLRTSTRRLAETLRLISSKATNTSRPYSIQYDLDKHKYCFAAAAFDAGTGQWVARISDGPDPKNSPAAAVTPSKCFPLKDGVFFKDIEPLTESGQEQQNGRLSTWYSPRGITDPLLIHLGDKQGRFYTLILSRYGGKVVVRQGRWSYKDYIQELLE